MLGETPFFVGAQNLLGILREGGALVKAEFNRISF